MDSKEFMERYGKVMMKFFRYYKHQFTYHGKTEAGDSVIATWWDEVDIYRYEVLADNLTPLEDLYPKEAVVMSGKDIIASYDKED